MRKNRQRLAEVVDLAEVRSQRRLGTYREKISDVLASNRRALGRLYMSGELFSTQGVRAGRDLLLAHQHLIKVVSILDELGDAGELPAPRKPSQIQALYRELDLLLDRTSALTRRTGNYLTRPQQE